MKEKAQELDEKLKELEAYENAVGRWGKMAQTYYRITEVETGRTKIVNGLELVENLITIPDIMRWEADGGQIVNKDKYDIAILNESQQKAAQILFGAKNKKKGQP